MLNEHPRPAFAFVLSLCLAIAGLGIGYSAEAAKNKWSSNGPFGGSVRALLVYPQGDVDGDPELEVVYAGVNGEGVFVSTNAGLDWDQVNSGLTDARVQALAVDNQIPPTSMQALTAEACSGHRQPGRFQRHLDSGQRHRRQ